MTTHERLEAHMKAFGGREHVMEVVVEALKTVCGYIDELREGKAPEGGRP